MKSSISHLENGLEYALCHSFSDSTGRNECSSFAPSFGRVAIDQCQILVNRSTLSLFSKGTMRAVAAVLALAAAASAMPMNHHGMFAKWKAQFGKAYATVGELSPPS